MFAKVFLLAFAVCSVVFDGAHAHGVITAVTGANGVKGQG